MAGNEDFKEVFNWWYFLAIVVALVEFPLLPTLAGIFTYLIK